MRFIVCTVVLLAIVVGCKPSPKNEPGLEGNKVSTQEEGPTKPEETELFAPIPPKVTIDANGVPDDAIVLFEGKNFDEWISAVDSTEVKWFLNSDGSMTVKDKTGDIQTRRNFENVQLHLE